MLYDRLPQARRVHLHRAAALRLKSAFGEPLGEIAAELAVHFELGRDAAAAVECLEIAADRAVRRYRNRDAIDFQTRALVLAKQLPREQCDLIRLSNHEKRGLIYRASSDIPASAADFQAMIDLAHRLQRADVQARGLFYLASVVSWIDR